MPKKSLLTDEERKAAKQAYNKAYYSVNRKEIREQQKSYRDDNKEEIKAQHKVYYSERGEEIREKNRAYHIENREHRNANRRAHHHANREHSNAKSRAYHAANREALNAKGRAYYAENQEGLLEQKKIYYVANREKISAKHKAYYAENPAQAHASTARYRANKANASVNDLTKEQWEEIKEHYDQRCVFCPPDCKACKKKTHRLTQEHLTPLSKGGNHTVANVVPACSSCNSKKHDGDVLKPVQPLLCIIAPAQPAKTRKKRAQI